MKTNLTAWVAVDGNGQTYLYRLKPRKSLAGQCWRVEIPGPKKARKAKR